MFQHPASVEVGEDAAKGTGVEFVLGERLVHTLASPVVTATIDGLEGKLGRLDG